MVLTMTTMQFGDGSFMNMIEVNKNLSKSGKFPFSFEIKNLINSYVFLIYYSTSIFNHQNIGKLTQPFQKMLKRFSLSLLILILFQSQKFPSKWQNFPRNEIPKLPTSSSYGDVDAHIDLMKNAR